MGAPSVTTTIIEDTPFSTQIHCTGSFTDTQETAALKLDVSTLKYIRPGVTAPRVAISRVQYNVSGTGIVKILWDASSDVQATQVSGAGDLQFASALIHNTAGSGITGDVLFTTTGMA